MYQTVPFSTFISSPIARMKIYFFCKMIQIHSKYARTKLHIGKTNPESLEEIHLSAKKRQQKVFFFFFFFFFFTFCKFMQGK